MGAGARRMVGCGSTSTARCPSVEGSPPLTIGNNNANAGVKRNVGNGPNLKHDSPNAKATGVYL